MTIFSENNEILFPCELVIKEEKERINLKAKVLVMIYRDLTATKILSCLEDSQAKNKKEHNKAPHQKNPTPNTYSTASIAQF